MHPTQHIDVAFLLFGGAFLAIAVIRLVEGLDRGRVVQVAALIILAAALFSVSALTFSPADGPLSGQDGPVQRSGTNSVPASLNAKGE